MAGRIGREIFGAAQILFLIFAMGSHILTFSIMMNTVTSHGTCTIAFSIIGTILCLLLTLPRTLKNISYMSIASFISIVSAVMITMVGVSVERPNDGNIDMTVSTNLYIGFGAVTNIIFAYAGMYKNIHPSIHAPLSAVRPSILIQHSPPGHVTFFSFISELRVPETYPKALFLLQGIDTTMYLIVALIIYCYAGTSVASPALGSTSPLIRKIAYGVATPTIMYVSPSFISLSPLPFLSNNSPLTPYQNRRRNLRPSRLQMHLRAPIPRHRPDEQANLALLRDMGAHRAGAMDHSVGDRGGDSRVQ